MNRVTVVGAGLAGCEAAWQLARRGIPVRLVDMKQELRQGNATGLSGLLREELEEQAKSYKVAEGVNLSTLHSSKGLEYDTVFLVDVNENVMPNKKAVLDADLEEERRMFYVGMTRARKQLALCYVRQQYEKKREPSRFLKEAGV